MSNKSKFYSAMSGGLGRLGGALQTHEARLRTASHFTDIMHNSGYTHLRSPEQICGRDLRHYISTRQQQGLSIRSLQNEAAHLRALLRASGRVAVADAPELSNRELKIAGGSRLGKKTPLSDAELTRVFDRATKGDCPRPGMGALFLLARYAGLRANEAICARADTLTRWLAEIDREKTIDVLEGTKGGRLRRVQIVDIENARAAVEFALSVAKAQGGFLVVRADGAATSSLKSARAIVDQWCQRANAMLHSARYAFAEDRVQGYQAKGYSIRETLLATSLDLGHGPGRGRWVRSVYTKGFRKTQVEQEDAGKAETTEIVIRF